MGVYGHDAYGVSVYGAALLPQVGGHLYLTDAGDYAVDDLGRLRREASVRSRCLVRLRTRRGSWVADPTFGSRIHEIAHLKNIDARLADVVREALQPLLDDGSLLAVETAVVALHRIDGAVYAEIRGTIPPSQRLDIGVIRLGQSAPE